MAEVYVKIVEGPDAGREVPAGDELVIGRGDAAELVIADPGVSRRHAVMRAEGQTAVIEDLGSSNGTYVNDEPVAQPRRVAEGDVIRLGASTLEVRLGPTQTETLPGEETEILTPPDSQKTLS
jgi:pSer/pThr/pTyr-binding forkhead associated (FHA) protein